MMPHFAVSGFFGIKVRSLLIIVSAINGDSNIFFAAQSATLISGNGGNPWSLNFISPAVVFYTAITLYCFNIGTGIKLVA